MNSILNASDEAPSSSHGEITPTSDVKMVEYTYMDPILYKAAAGGDFGPFAQIKKELSLIVTPDKNTVLHIHVRSQSDASEAAVRFLEQVLGKCPSLLMQVNAIGDTPLHAAAKSGHAPMVEFLINRAKGENERGLDNVKQMVRNTNNVGNTPLHEAVQNNFAGVVTILTKEDTDFLYPANNLGETPLYIAVDKGSYDMVDEILNNCRKLAYQGPHGRTALHAAVVAQRRFFYDSIVRKRLEKMMSLATEVDEYGWTPLHYAAYYNWMGTVKTLLEFDVSAAYMGDKERKLTPLLLAASQGHTDIIEEIINCCPTCYELVDIRGWNVFHYAIFTSYSERTCAIVSKCLPLEKLKYQKDVDGNTPLHVFAAFYRQYVFRKRLSFLHPEFDDSILYASTNKQGLDVPYIIEYGSPQLKEEILRLSKIDQEPYRYGLLSIGTSYKTEHEKESEELAEIERAKNSHLVVAALIATVTFAAAFTLPGGYIQDGSNHQGTAILKRKPAFQAFVISNSIAMVLSISAVFIHFIMSLQKFKSFVFLFWYAFYFTLLAMGAMVIAFITGAFAMLRPCLWLAIVTIFIGLTFFFVLVIFLYVRHKVESFERLHFLIFGRLPSSYPTLPTLSEMLY